MTSQDALKQLGWKNDDPMPDLPKLLAWAERIVPNIPAADLDYCRFSVEVFEDDRRGYAGFNVVFNEKFTSADFDCLQLFIQRQELLLNDPLIGNQATLYSSDYPSLKDFFAAVRADPHYRFACNYPFNEVAIRDHPLAGSTKRSA
jgi:hypothetical protein